MLLLYVNILSTGFCVNLIVVLYLDVLSIAIASCLMLHLDVLKAHFLAIFSDVLSLMD